MLLKTNCFSRKDVNRELTVLVIQFHFQKWNAAYTTLEWFHLSSLSHTDWDRRNHHHCSTVIDRWVTKECRSGKKEREREKERRGKRGRSQGTATLCYGCTCPSTTCSTASQHQQLTQLVPESERQRQGWERLGFISNLQGPTGKKRGKEVGCELIFTVHCKLSFLHNPACSGWHYIYSHQWTKHSRNN